MKKSRRVGTAHQNRQTVCPTVGGAHPTHCRLPTADCPIHPSRLRRISPQAQHLSFILHPSARRAFTLVEIMIATVLTLVLMIMVVQIFAMVGTATTDTRSMLELNERLRNCKITLQADLANITARMLPPLKVEDQAGYFEYVEGLMGPVPNPPAPYVAMQAIDSERGILDTTVGDIDDVLMFTTRNESQPFYGRTRTPQTIGVAPAALTQWVDTTTTSQYAEVCYFVRGNTLYRRMLLVNGALSTPTVNNPVGAGFINPESLSTTYALPYPATLSPPAAPYLYNISFYDKYDISVHQEGGTYDTTGGTATVPVLKANTLGDLTRRENRYGHQSHAYPYDARFWGPLGLPTLRECTFYTDIFGAFGGPTARWPFPFYDPADISAATLWGSAFATPQNSIVPPVNPSYYIYPYPSVPAVAAAYQGYYQTQNQLPSGATTSTVPPAPGGLPQYIYLTQNGVFPANTIDSWLIPTYPWDQVSPFNGAIAAFSLSPDEPDPTNAGQYDASTRVSDDVILTNVISFDVKAWDPQAPILFGTIPAGPLTPGNATSTTYLPGDGGVNIIGGVTVSGGNYLAALQALGTTTTIAGFGAYVDLAYQQQIGNLHPSIFSAAGLVYVGPPGNLPFPYAVYDTGCFAYEEDGIDQDGRYGPDQYTNGFDDNNFGGVDDLTELEAPVPYPYPLKGIQIKIRVFEPDSRQIREITVVEDFLWE